MKFKDPLASLNYIGGPVSNHIVLAFFAGRLLFIRRPEYDCPAMTDEEMQLEFFPILVMMWCHAVYVVAKFAEKGLRKSKASTAYFKTLVTFIAIIAYFLGYFYIQYN